MGIIQYVSQVLLFLTLMQNINGIGGERTRDKMYISIDGASCFRRLNGTHQTGCSSLLEGSVGVLHLIETEIDFEFVLNNPPAPPYAPVLAPHLFTRANVLRLKNEGGNYISVVLLLDKRINVTQFSHELTCPNQYSGIVDDSGKSSTCDQNNLTDTWNPYGSGLLYEDFPFPIYFISNVEEMEKILNCFYDFNGFDYESHKHRSLCAIEVKSFMSAAVNSEVCRRRTNFVNNLGRTNYCDPLEGRNVYATLFPRAVNSQERNERNGTDISEKFILVSCRMDTTSMFDGVGLGALDSLVGYITLMSVAHTLANILPQNNKLPDKRQNVFFVIFDGESYDYIGSQRFVYDLENVAFTAHSDMISLKNIDLMVDIGTLDDISSLSLHSVKDFTQSKEFANKLINYGTKSTLGLKVNVEAATGPHMPPTSAQSFLRKNVSFPAVVINSKPFNRFYHSIYDDLRNINFNYMNTSSNFTALIENKAAGDYFPSDSIQMKIRNVSSAIALALYEMLTRTMYTDSKIANPILIDELLYCFLESASCPLFKAASHPNSLPTLAIPPQRYISVSGSSQEASGWTYRLLGYILSQKQPRIKKENCTNLPLFWYSGYNGAGECRLTTQNYSHALSPAFLIPDYTWSSGQYSTWTESTWMQISARIFLKPSSMQEIVTLSIGFIILLMSFLLVYIINRKSDVLFEDAPISSNM